MSRPAHESDAGPTFRNPLHGGIFADPFVLKFNCRYYAYGTPPLGEALPVLRSVDLVHWETAGELLGRPAAGLSHWAPEVAYDNGRFFLYYSAGGAEGEGQQLRVAVGGSPTGPFDEDLGLLDPDDPFTIDAHPFHDDDGQWYLFYSRDFLDAEPVGTGIVVDKLLDMSKLGGERTTVMRPHADWHLFERNRRWYDRVWDWYTVEGPFVRKHDGRYWCFYSGGAWKADNYGISSAVADDPLGPFEPVQGSDTADVLRTVPDRVIGPGHGSVTVAPDNLTEYLVYHAWDLGQTGRYMCADRLVWSHDRPQSPGPRTDPQPSPPQPMLSDLFEAGCGDPQLEHWQLQGRWEVESGQLFQPGDAEPATAVVRAQTPQSFLFEVNVAARSHSSRPGGMYGALASYHDGANYTAVLLQPEAGLLCWQTHEAGVLASSGELTRLRADFRAEAYHQLLLRREGPRVHVRLDGVSVGPLGADLGPGAVGLISTGAPVAFAGVALSDLRVDH